MSIDATGDVPTPPRLATAWQIGQLRGTTGWLALSGGCRPSRRLLRARSGFVDMEIEFRSVCAHHGPAPQPGWLLSVAGATGTGLGWGRPLPLPLLRRRQTGPAGSGALGPPRPPVGGLRVMTILAPAAAREDVMIARRRACCGLPNLQALCIKVQESALPWERPSIHADREAVLEMKT